MSRPRRGQVVDAVALEQDLARIRRVESGQQVQQSALARTALAHDGRQLSGLDAQIHSLQDRDLHLPLAVALLQVSGGQDGGLPGSGRSGPVPPCRATHWAGRFRPAGFQAESGIFRDRRQVTHSAKPPPDGAGRREWRAARSRARR